MPLSSIHNKKRRKNIALFLSLTGIVAVFFIAAMIKVKVS
jgi:hypothetical protein